MSVSLVNGRRPPVCRHGKRRLDCGEVARKVASSALTHSVWAITDKGRQRLAKVSASVPVAAPAQDVLSLYEDYERLFRQTVRARLLEMTPTAFERFARRLMEAYGFSQVEITSATGDGGMDGFGRLRVGLSLMDVAFQ